MKFAWCVFVVLCLINVSMVASLLTTKSCAEFGPPVRHFSVRRYVGFWFLHQLYDFPGSHQYECFVLTRTLRDDGNMNVTQILLKPDLHDIPEIQASGVSTFPEQTVGRYIYTSEENPAYDGTVYIVVATDYTSYTVEYSCRDIVGGGSEVEFYAMTRDAASSRYTQSQIDKVIIAHRFNDYPIRKMNITSCPEEVKRNNQGLIDVLLRLVTGLVGNVLGLTGGLLGGLLG